MSYDAFITGMLFITGFEKMDRGLSSKYTDNVHPVDNHFDHMEKLGAKPGLINPRLNKMTSDVIKVCYLYHLLLIMFHGGVYENNLCF